MITIANIHTEFSNRRMVQEECAENIVMKSPRHHAAGTSIGHRHGATAARPMKRQPSAARFDPLLDLSRLDIIEIGTRRIGHEEIGQGQPAFDFVEIAGNMGRRVPVCLQLLKNLQNK